MSSILTTQDDAAVRGTVTAVWEKLLGKQGIAPDQEFFDVGGNSMLLIAMVDAVQQQLQKEVELAQLANGITINKLTVLLA